MHITGNNYDHTAHDFAALSGCEQLVAGATQMSGNCLDLVLTNVNSLSIDIFKSKINKFFFQD